MDDALAYLDQLDDFLAEAAKHNTATMLGSGAGFDSRQTTTTSEIPQGDAQTMGQKKMESPADESTLPSEQKEDTIESTTPTEKQATRRRGEAKPPKLSKQEWRQVQAAQMQKYGGMEESEIPERGYVFAHDKFYVIRNYGAGSFEVEICLDPEAQAGVIGKAIRRINGEDNEQFGTILGEIDAKRPGDR